MDNIEKVFETFKNSPEPLNATGVAEISGLDKKDVDKAMAKLKKDGRITSPKRCYYEASK